ncbi:unnamed protein product [Ranitomeya imitator]|uniref:Transposase n=1 Tax=Ranitomeya imitator TaxID=111125 RepID=A0ABN9M0A1_9NEOB|nr:unnamed protein product [Ranitomeya imitator]
MNVNSGLNPTALLCLVFQPTPPIVYAASHSHSVEGMNMHRNVEALAHFRIGKVIWFPTLSGTCRKAGTGQSSNFTPGPHKRRPDEETPNYYPILSSVILSLTHFSPCCSLPHTLSSMLFSSSQTGLHVILSLTLSSMLFSPSQTDLHTVLHVILSLTDCPSCYFLPHRLSSMLFSPSHTVIHAEIAPLVLYSSHTQGLSGKGERQLCNNTHLLLARSLVLRALTASSWVEPHIHYCNEEYRVTAHYRMKLPAPENQGLHRARSSNSIWGKYLFGASYGAMCSIIWGKYLYGASYWAMQGCGVVSFIGKHRVTKRGPALSYPMFTLVTSEDIAESVSHTPIQRCLRGVQRRNKVLDFLPRPAISQQGPDRCCLSHWTISLVRTLQRHGSLAISSSVTVPLLKTPIMGKTSDLTDVKKAIIDTLKQEGKTQKEISQQIGCSQSAVSRHLNGKSVGRKQCGRKRCTMRRGDRTLRKIVEKDRFQTLGNLRKQWTESGVETSRATVHRRVQEMGYRCRIPQVKPLLNHKQRQRRLTWATEKQHWTVAKWSQVLFSDESKFCMSFGNQGARVWRKTGEKEMPKCLKSSVKYPQSVMVWGAMSAAGVGPLCFIKGRVNAASYQEILEHFMLPSAEMLYGDEDFIFQHDLAPAHSAKTTGKWFTDHGITVLNWPANSPDLNPIENLWDIVKRKLRDARPNTLDELKAAIEASWASITSQQCHRLIASMPRRIEAVISAKGFPTKY